MLTRRNLPFFLLVEFEGAVAPIELDLYYYFPFLDEEEEFSQEDTDPYFPQPVSEKIE